MGLTQRILTPSDNAPAIPPEADLRLLQGRFKAILVDMDEYAKELLRYIHLNPIRAKMVDRLQDYRWSSYPDYIGNRNPPAWLERDFILGYFGKKPSVAQKYYREFIDAGLGKKI